MSTLTSLSMPVQQVGGGDQALEEIHQAHDFDLIIYDCSRQEHRAKGHCNCVDCCSKIIANNNAKTMLVVLDHQDKKKVIPGNDGDLYCFIEKPLSTFCLAQGINNFFKEENLSEAL